MESEIPLRMEPWESAHWDPEWDIPEYDLTGCSGSHMWAFPNWLIEDLPGGAPLPASTAEQREHPAVPVLNGLNDPHKPIRAYAFCAPDDRHRALRRAARDRPGDGPTRRVAGTALAKPTEYSYHLYIAAEDPAQGITWAITAAARD